MSKLASFFILLSLCACSDELTEMSPFDEFEAATHREPFRNGVYIVDGDMPVIDKKALRELWEARFSTNRLIVHRSGDLDARWNETDKHALTYCVSDLFGPRKADALAAMVAATDDGWEQHADVDFIHVPSEDATCDERNPNVVFDVRPVWGQPYLARAFFPNYPRASRSLLINTPAFTSEWPLANILVHETGHALGFRHEHTRPEAAICFEDSNWRPLTEYDAASTMHYPQCNGSSTTLALTELDAQGAAALYGMPGGDPPEPQPMREHRQNGSVAAGEWLALEPFAVAPGSRFEVQLAGSGDPDLYVRFDAAPTKLEYDCRPYLEGAGESCAIDAPETATTAHVAIHGFTAADYEVVVKYVAAEHDGAPELVIDEILADPGAVVDANGDGVTSATEDEMIEIVNIGDAPIDLGGATLADGVAVRVTLADGLVLAPGEALVMFGGGTPASLGARVKVVVGRLYLDNAGDTITLYDRSGATLATVTYGARADHDQSLVRQTELDPTAPWVRHTEVSTLRASPGRRFDGTPF